MSDNTKNQLLQYLPLAAVVVGAVIGWANLKNQVQTNATYHTEAKDKIESLSDWQDAWEKNDIQQNHGIDTLTEKMDKIEAMKLEARLVAIETNQENIVTNQQGLQAHLKKIDALVLEVRDAVISK